MFLRKFKYLFAFTLPILILFSFHLMGFWVWMPILFAFVLVPVLDAIVPADNSNVDEAEEVQLKNEWWFKFMLYLVVPVHFYVLYVFLDQVMQVEASEAAGMIVSAGLSCGVLGINVGHELGHKNTPFDKLMAHLLLMSSLYMHFYIEHNYGHHKRVATPEDPATARKGEALYVFWIRSILNSYISAWNIQMQLLTQKSFWSSKNNMLIYHIVQPLLIVGVGWYFGWMLILYFLGAAVIGVLLLETVNYIEHYGLQRKKKGSAYERTTFEHSWNSNHIMGRLVLFELSRHSDHHFKSVRPYQILRHHDGSPQLPAGYPAMMLLSLIPPLWFRIVDPIIQKQ